MSEADLGRQGGPPLQLTSFIGRRREVAEIKRLVTESRLVTLTGVGGSGKSRLAMRVAEELRRSFHDGVAFVDVAALRPPDLVSVQAEDADVLAYLILIAFGLRERLQGGSAKEQLTAYLSERNTVLLLDNSEHMLAACAEVVDTLLRGCPHVTVLASSREPFMLSGEAVYQVAPMSLPESGRSLALADVSRSEAVALFVARAQSLVPGFELNEANAAAVAEICRQLDGLPLAVELAAAWVRVLAPSQIVQRLGARFKLLSQGSRHLGDERQQTLRGCMEWSFDLCSKSERLFWVRSSVFAGGFELDAAEAVCTDDNLPVSEVLDVIAGLVDKSVLIGERLQGVMRYRMLETVRQYGQDRLLDPGSDLALDPEERARLRFRHLDWARGLAEEADREWLGPKQAEWIDRMERELPNFRMALRFGIDDDAPGAEAALDVARRLRLIWLTRGQLYGEAVYWLQEAVARATAPTLARVQALTDITRLRSRLPDAEGTAEPLAEARAVAAQLDDPRAMAIVDTAEAAVRMAADDRTGALEAWSRAVAGLDGADEHPFLSWRLFALDGAAAAAAVNGDVETVDRHHAAVVELCRPRGEQWFLGISFWSLGYVTWRAGDLAGAGDRLREGLRLLRAAGDRVGTIWCIGALARIQFEEGQAEQAAVLIGAKRELSIEVGADEAVIPEVTRVRAEYADRIRAALGDQMYDAAVERGRTLSFDDVVAMALGESQRSPAAATTAPEEQVVLSTREREVAELVAAGLSNRQIAERLVISPRTAEGHVQRVLVKLGFTSRTQLAAWVTAHRVDGQDAPLGR